MRGFPNHKNGDPPCLQSDWRQLPFATGLHCLQALSPLGGTASGAGETREDARNRCLGELAEIAAIRAGAQWSPSSHHWAGIAAHPDHAMARQTALLEALERAAVDLWWQGHSPAIPVNLHTGEGEIVQTYLTRFRGNGHDLRSTRIYILKAVWPLCVCLAISTPRPSYHKDRAQVIWGYGAGPTLKDAARSALVELMLMELNLEDAVSEQSRQFRLEKSLQLFKREDLFVSPVWENNSYTLQKQTCQFVLDETVKLHQLDVNFRLLTLQNSDLPVWRATVEGPPTFGTPTSVDKQMLL